MEDWQCELIAQAWHTAWHIWYQERGQYDGSSSIAYLHLNQRQG